jgi:hypothetical protein
MLSKVNLPAFDYFFNKEIVGKEMAYKTHCIKGVYDFSYDGGAVGAINLKDLNHDLVKLPAGAIVKQVLIDVVSAPTSGGAATIALGINSTTDLKAATGYASFSGLVAGEPIGSAATMVKVKLTSISKLCTQYRRKNEFKKSKI